MSTTTVWAPPYDEEEFTYVHLAWDVATAWRLVGSQDVVDHIDVDNFARSLFGAPSAVDMLPPADPSAPRRLYLGVGVDVDWCLDNDLDLTRPVLVVQRTLPNAGDPVTVMIDGYHRLWRAWHDGVERLPAILLTAAQERKVRIR